MSLFLSSHSSQFYLAVSRRTPRNLAPRDVAAPPRNLAPRDLATAHLATSHLAAENLQFFGGVLFYPDIFYVYERLREKVDEISSEFSFR